MLQLRSPKWSKNHLKGLSNPKTHVQKKYFSLMLVPSYTSGRTRSIRIPYATFYVIFFSFVVIGLIVSFLYLRAQFFMNQAAETSAHLEQTVVEFETFQEETAEEQARLREQSRELNQALTRERMQAFEEQMRQSQTYQEALESIHSYVESLEQQLDIFENYRQEILNQLMSQSHIPPVRNLIDEMNRNQSGLISSMDEINEALYQQRTPTILALSSISDIAGDEYPRIISLASIMNQNYDIIGDDIILTAEDLFDYIDLLEARLEIQMELFSQLSSQMDLIGPHIRSHPTRRPINGRVTSHFGWRRSPWGGGGGQMHNGIDISAPSGTAIRATGGGTVVFSGWQGAYGQKVIIDHGFGIRTVYAHNSRNLVSVGQRVNRGDHIANVGSTGNSTGPHVHYEVLVNGTAVNPVNFFLE